MDVQRYPVIVGVGEVCDRPAGGVEGLSTAALIVLAIRAAAADSGVASILDLLDSIAIVDALSRPDRSVPLHVEICERLGVTPPLAQSSPSPSGNYPVRFLNDAANAISAGDGEIFLIAGGEAMRSYTRRRGASAGSGTAVIRGYRGDAELDVLQRHDLITPLDIYPLYEQATRHAWGQTLAVARNESGVIWEGNARVAAGNPNAWIRDARRADVIVTPADDNPMLGFPYTRSMVANSGVNQAAAILCMSYARAIALGIPAERLIYVGYGAAANEPAGNLDRATFAHSPAMEVSLRQTLALNGLDVGDLDHVELYSCFPCVPKMARRVIGWPIERPHSIYGGLTFGGGPIGNCMTHALGELVRRIREGSANGLVFANGGFATRNHAIVLTRSAMPGGRAPKSYDFQAEADAIRPPVATLLDRYDGPATIETYAIPFAAGQPRHATIVARTPSGDRALARVAAEDRATLAWLMSEQSDPVGASGTIEPGEDGVARWRSA